MNDIYQQDSKDKNKSDKPVSGQQSTEEKPNTSFAPKFDIEKFKREQAKEMFGRQDSPAVKPTSGGAGYGFGVNYERNLDFRQGVPFELKTTQGVNNFHALMAYVTKYVGNGNHGFTITYDTVKGDYQQLNAGYVYEKPDGNLQLVFSLGGLRDEETKKTSIRSFNVATAHVKKFEMDVYGQLELGKGPYAQLDFKKSVNWTLFDADVKPAVSFRNIDGQHANFGLSFDADKVSVYFYANQNGVIVGTTFDFSKKK